MRNAFAVGERTYLRPIEPADAPVVAACNNDPDVRVTFFTNVPVSLHAQEHRIAELYKPGADYIPFIIALREDDSAIGVTAFHRIDYISRYAIYSICISDAAQRGHGHGIEVTNLMLAYGFDVLNLHRIELKTWTGNAAAARAYEKCGFQHEGLLRQAMRHDGEWCDFHVMAMLEDEWRGR